MTFDTMEVIKGKGLTAVSTIFIAIAWFNQPLRDYSFQGFPFHEIPEWKLLTPLILAWLLFLYRYLQGIGEMRDNVKLAFLKWLKKKDRWTVYNEMSSSKIDFIQIETNFEYHIVGKWGYVYDTPGNAGNRKLKYHSFEEVDEDYKKKWRTFKLRNRTYLNYFLPVGFAVCGLASLLLILYRLYY